MTGVIFDIKRYAIHDGPGIRTTVFFKGCPLRCRWCHNPESWVTLPEPSWRGRRCLACGECFRTCDAGAITLKDNQPATDAARCTVCGECVDACPGEAREIIGRSVESATLATEIEKDLVFYEQSGGGVTFSGGEPLQQPDFLQALLEECRAREIHTAVDTSGYAEPQVIQRINEQVDLWLFDLKHIDNQAHQRLTGAGNELILENIRRLASAGSNVVVRVAVVPGFNDDDANIEATGRFVASLDRVSGVDVLPYHGAGHEKSNRLTGPRVVLNTRAPDAQRLRTIAERLRSFGLQVRTGG